MRDLRLGVKDAMNAMSNKITDNREAFGLGIGLNSRTDIANPSARLDGFNPDPSNFFGDFYQFASLWRDIAYQKSA